MAKKKQMESRELVITLKGLVFHVDVKILGGGDFLIEGIAEARVIGYACVLPEEFTDLMIESPMIHTEIYHLCAEVLF